MREKAIVDRMLEDNNKFNSHEWWRSLSLAEMDKLSKKYYPNLTRYFIGSVPSLIFSIYEQEQGGVR